MRRRTAQMKNTPTQATVSCLGLWASALLLAEQPRPDPLHGPTQTRKHEVPQVQVQVQAQPGAA